MAVLSFLVNLRLQINFDILYKIMLFYKNTVVRFIKRIDFKPKLFETIKDYDKKTFMSDLMAGIIVGIVALPLAIAFAISSGVEPEKGIITAVIAGFIISFFGGSKVQIGGPTGAFIVIVYGVVVKYGITGLLISTIMAGFILLILGIFKLGTIIKYIPYPIIVGFTSGIAVTIFTTQIADLFGMNFGGEHAPADFIGKWVMYFKYISTVDLIVMLIGLSSIAIIVFTPKISKKIYKILEKKAESAPLHTRKTFLVLSKIANIFAKIPGSLMAIILITVAVIFLKSWGIEGIDTIGDRFSIKASLPGAQVPNITWPNIIELMPVAISIALLGAIESLLSATVADGVINDKHDSNTELMAQGIANIVTPIFGGIPATGAIARTMTNINNGGKTPVAGIIHAFVLLLILLFLMPLAKYIPMACLAGVLVIVSYNMSEWRTFKMMLNNPKSDVTVLLVTFFLTVIFDLTVAIQVGIVIACLFFMKRVAQTTNISVITGHEDANQTEYDEEPAIIVPDGVEVYEINGPYFFGIANKFEEQISRIKDESYVRIIRMRKVPFIDSTGINNLTNLCKNSTKKGIKIVLSGVRPNVHNDLERMGFNDLIGKENICSNISAALYRAEEITQQILDEKAYIKNQKEDLQSIENNIKDE